MQESNNSETKVNTTVEQESADILALEPTAKEFQDETPVADEAANPKPHSEAIHEGVIEENAPPSESSEQQDIASDAPEEMANETLENEPPENEILESEESIPQQNPNEETLPSEEHSEEMNQQEPPIALKEENSEITEPLSQSQPVESEIDLDTQPEDELIGDEKELTIDPALHDTIFGDEDIDKAALAEINFDLVDAGRWLLKVIAGPNTGAEFSMHSASSYVIGTDPTSCDIVFHDTSVSRQHARLTISPEDELTIEDLKSRNQTLIDGESIKIKTPLTPNAVVTIGTTAFTVYDREGEMHTIISPLLPAIVKALQKDEPAKTEAPTAQSPEALAAGEPAEITAVETATEEPSKAPEKSPEKAAHAIGAFIVLGIISGLFVIIGLGTAALFRSEPVVIEQETNAAEMLQTALIPFPSITPYFNKSTGVLQLMGHVMTQADKSRLMYSLQGLPFVKTIDDGGVIIDEYVWQETNLVLSKNSNWKGITIQAPAPGKFIITGYLQTRAEADRLSEYMGANFPYIDLLEKRITVEEDVVNKANSLLQTAGLRDVTISMEKGILTLTGGFAPAKEAEFQTTLNELGKIPGVRGVKNLTSKLAPEQSVINISDRYEVTGSSRLGATYSIVINGRILTKGDELDGMQITEIRANSVVLEKDGVQYRIDFSR